MRFVLAGSVSSAVFAAAAFTCAHAQQPSPVMLEGADSDTLRAISATLPERARPETVFDAERLAEEAAERAEAWMRSEGYYAGAAIPKTDENPPRARVAIALGARFVFAAPTASFAGGAFDPATDKAVRAALDQVKEGAPARAAAVLGAEAAAVLVLQDHGYANAKAGARSAIVDHATGKMSVAFAFDLGAPVRLGEVRVDPPSVVKSEFVDKLKQWKSGDSYSLDKLVTLRRDLSATGAFSRVQVSLAPEANANGEYDVLVRLAPAKLHSIALGGSYSTTDGPGIDAQWTRRNIYGRADSLTLGADIATMDQKLDAEWFRPHAVGRGRGRRYGLTVEHQNINPYERSAVTLSYAVEAEPTVKSASTYGLSLAANAYTQSAGISNALIFTGFLDHRADSTDEKLDPRRGTIIEGRVEPAIAFGDASTAFVRGTLDARGYWSPGKAKRTTFAARLGGGWVQPLLGDADDLPLDRRFYAGGGGSVRGYEYNSIYPAAGIATTEPPGGQGLLQTSLEARFRATGAIGGALFVDGGSAFNDLSEARDVRWSAGFGLRYNLGFAPLRFDVAAPLNRRPGDPNVAFYVSLGQAF